ncbi:MAG: hypothetical protein WEB60_13795 [Terrimicrobiaceae bacterium]
MPDPFIDTADEGVKEIKFSVHPQKRPTKGKGPFKLVKVGQVTVPIYRSDVQGFPRFFVAYYENGFRIRRSFTDLEEAKQEARRAGERVMSCKVQAPRLAPHECDELIRAKKAVAPSGSSLVSAAEEFAQCHKMLGGRSLIGAIRDYVERNKGVRPGVPVTKAAEEFLASKEQDGASSRYMAQLRSDVNRFAAAFPTDILHVKSHQISEWLRGLGGAPRTRNSTHTSIRTFFSWARSASYLPKNEKTEAEAVQKVKAGDTETEIFTPEQMKTILDTATPDMIPFIALGAFAGMRAAEITRRRVVREGASLSANHRGNGRLAR